MKAKLEAAQARQGPGRGAGPPVFGGDGHRWKLLPPMAEKNLLALERRHGVTLPDGYRGYLLQVASGGAGPGYGVLTPDAALAVDGEPHSLAAPFPWSAAHNPYTGGPDPDDATYVRQVSGTLAICHEGCGYYHRLVVTGPARGTMWLDARTSDGGFHPLGVDFLSWFGRWLDDVLAGGDGVSRG